MSPRTIYAFRPYLYDSYHYNTRLLLGVYFSGFSAQPPGVTVRALSASAGLLEALGTLGLSLVVTLPGQLPVQDLEAAVGK